MMEPRCSVCGETKIANLFMFNHGMCLCHRCMGTAAQTFVHDSAERRLKENKEKVIIVDDLPKAKYESMTEFKDRLRKEIEASIETKVRAETEARRKASRKASRKARRKASRKARRKARRKASRKASRITEAEIKFANGTHEALRGKCSCCGKAVHPSLITRVHGKYGCEPYKLCPDCYKDYRRDKADLSIENNRLRTGLKDLKEEYESFRERTRRVWWGVVVAGFALGSLVTLMFLNPR